MTRDKERLCQFKDTVSPDLQHLGWTYLVDDLPWQAKIDLDHIVKEVEQRGRRSTQVDSRPH